MSIKRNYPESFYSEIATIKGTILSIPNKVDTTDGTTIYSAYTYIDTTSLEAEDVYLIKKTIIDGALITNYFAYGAWEDRATLDYTGE